jgi:fibronectin-binding autotransporter adhesin
VRASSVGPASGSGTLGLLEAGAATFSGNVTLHGAATLTAADDATATFSGVLSGGGSVTKTGLGTVVLSSANTFGGGVTVSAGTLLIGDVAALGTGVVTVAGGVLDLANLAPTNIINLAGGSLANAAAWGATGVVEISGAVDAALINSLAAAEIVIAPGATVDLTGVTKDIVFKGGSLENLAGFTGRLTVQGVLDLSAGEPGGDIELAAGGSLDFGNRSSNLTIRYTGGSISGAGFTGTVEVDGAATLTSAIGAGSVRLAAGANATIQSGFTQALRLEAGATLGGLDNYSGELTLAGATLSTTGITTDATLVVEAGSILSGSGTIGSLVQVAGSTLAPGNSPGILNVTGTHVLAGGAAMEVEFHDLATSSLAGTNYDAVVAGTLDLSGLSAANRYTLDLVSLSALPSTQGALAGFDASLSYTFDLFVYGSILLPESYSGVLGDYFLIDTTLFRDAFGNSVSALGFSLFNNADDKKLQLVYAPIPEPSTYGLILGGLALAGAAVRRRRQRA